MRIAVIGAGIVGACCAVELARDGHEVIVVEPGEPGGEHAASYGNGAWISPASVVPMSMPGLWKKVPGYLLDRTGPLTIRPGALPHLLPWLVRFVAAGRSVERVERTARALAALLGESPRLHQALAAEAGVARLVEQRGLLYAYPDRAGFEAEALAWRLRRDNGVAWRELDAPALAAAVPMLSPRYRFGALVEAGAHCRDPGAYVAALTGLACRLGARLEKARADRFVVEGGRLRGLETSAGRIDCERAVIAAGIAGARLARACGNRIALESERGYHVALADPGFELPLPVMPSDGKMGNTGTDAGLRFAGQVELARHDAPPDWRRADILLEHARLAYPVLAGRDFGAGVRRWMGHRPSTPDGLPVIGAARAVPDVLFAFGHGHVGLAAAPASARLVADLAGGRVPATDPSPYSPDRFS